MRMRISTTTLESFRLWSDPEQEWMSEEDLINGILGRFIPTHEVLLGMAYHSVIEHPEAFRCEGGDAYICGEFVFPAETVDPLLALLDRRGMFELKATQEIDDCVIVAKCDYLYGLLLDEFKTTLGSFDAEKYLNSCQWRFMGLLFQPAQITYRVACLSERAKDNSIVLRSLENLTVYPYGGMRDDCRELLSRFKHYVKVRGLDGYLRERQESAEKRFTKDDGQLVLEGIL